MNTATKLAICLSAIALGACADPEDDTPPIDMVYRASAILLENTCDDDAPPAGEAWYIDVMPRADGSCDVTLSGVWLFGETYFEGIAWRGGAISHRNDWSSYSDGGNYRSALGGNITPEAAELTATTEETAADGKPCRRSLKLFGTPRRFSDPAALEGYYKLDTLAYAYGCGPNGSGQQAFKGAIITDIDPNRTWDGSQFKTTDGLYFDLGRVDAGAVDWNGKVFSVGQTGFIREFRGDLTGQVSPDGTDLALRVYGPDTPAGCGVPYSFKGRKLLPDATTVDGEYRAESRRHGQCFGETVNEKSSLSVVSVAQEEGKVAFYQGTERILLNREGDVVSLTRTPTGGITLKYSGTMSPPKLSIRINHDEESWLGSCHTTTDIEAVKRFIPAATD